jgi:predicted nucleic acid-binding protein
MARRSSRLSGKRHSPRKNATFVLDCSVALGWFFSDETNDYADSVAAALPATIALSPSLWQLEVANCILVGERRGRCTEAQSTAFLGELALLPIVFDHQSPKTMQSVVAIARNHALSSYDAAYLELALRTSLPIASLDKKLLAAASAAGIKTFVPAP